MRTHFCGEDTRRNFAPRKMRPQSSVGCGEKLQAQEFAQNYVLCSVEAKVMPAPTSTRPEEREFVVDSGASMHMSKKELSSGEMDTARRSRTLTVVSTDKFSFTIQICS